LGGYQPAFGLSQYIAHTLQATPALGAFAAMRVNMFGSHATIFNGLGHLAFCYCCAIAHIHCAFPLVCASPLLAIDYQLQHHAVKGKRQSTDFPDFKIINA
jgi:hypothetical protein